MALGEASLTDRIVIEKRKYRPRVLHRNRATLLVERSRLPCETAVPELPHEGEAPHRPVRVHDREQRLLALERLHVAVWLGDEHHLRY
jgi:hypothetical protein